MSAGVEFPEHTLAEVLDQLANRGFAGSFHIDDSTIPPGVRCSTCHRHLLPGPIHVAETWRFEGASDPDDEAVVLAFTCPRCQTGGVLVCAYGPDAPAAEAEVMAALDQTPTVDPHPREQATDATHPIPPQGGDP